MAKAQGNIFKRAKLERKKHPRKFKTWAEYVTFAAKKVKAPARKKRKVAGKKKTARKKVSRKKPVKRKTKKPSRRVGAIVKEKRDGEVVYRLTTPITKLKWKKGVGKRKRSKPRAKPKSRRRSVSGKGHSGLLIGLAVAAGAYFLLSGMGKTAPTTPYAGQYGTLNNTVNPVRNTQSQDIINYAIAAGLAADTIADLISRFNNSSDDEIKQVYDYVNTTGDIEYYA